MDIFEAAKLFGVFPAGIVCGLILGAIYELLRLLRKIIPHKKPVVFAEDMLYVLFYWLVMFTFGAGVAGEIRYYILAAFAFGTAMIMGLIRCFIPNSIAKCT